ncbi:Ig domain-containing protein [Amycolatopsis saalfeldensis]|uniref:Putative Ig domain-containing protein n=1 Tax=Amycolatopsis saalfeldensis TaxID=394193 RepID=A0A1H8YP09_9PSEU|nr:Ig domain-containing protein [Amycolatopsis saalfeldensis]SEP53889.1 Putative Ig domain-containing protein [Amycolatopsis saalfeldensis]
MQRTTRTRLAAALAVIAAGAALSIPALSSATPQDPDQAGQSGEVENEALVAQPAATAGSCGVERWAVKTGTDSDASKIALQSTTDTTIAALDALPKPGSLPADTRIQPTETTVFRLKATLTQYKLESDSDYHLVMSDGAGHTMITEIPDPACVGSASPLTSSIQKSRAEFNAKYTPTGSFQTANVPVTVTGVGFFDFLHGQTGVAPNGIELHAVLDIQFGGSSGGSVSVANPGNQTATAGQPASLQMSATDTATGTLSYSATGLPAGLSINSATGLISGVPATAGTSSVTVTASDSTGPSGSASFTWTIAQAGGGGCTAQQVLGNPGFETGTPSPWAASAGIIKNSASEPPHAGSWDAWLDGHGSAHTDTLAQTVTLPTGCATYAMSFWLHVDTAETSTTTAYDSLTLQILNSAGTVLATPATYSNRDAANGYVQHRVDLSAYAGQTITVKFTGTEDYTKQTSFVLDDTALNLS